MNWLSLKINLNWYNLNFILMPKNTTKPMANRKSGKSGKATRSKSVTGQTKAGIVFGTGRIQRYLRQGRYSERVG